MAAYQTLKGTSKDMINKDFKGKLFAISVEIPDKSGIKTTVEPGRAHYSYKSVKDKFCELFDESGQPWIELKNPEIYRDFNLKETIFSNQNTEKVHISFKPPQYLRTAGGFKNIAHVAWEFERIRSKYSLQPVLPANDDIRMLLAFDQVWVGCEFTKSVFERHGLKSVHIIPAPIKTPPQNLTSRESNLQLSKLEKIKKENILCWPVSVRNHGFMYAEKSIKRAPVEISNLLRKAHKSRDGKTFLQIVNPHDRRKNIKKLIKAFHAARHNHPDSILILKLTSPEKGEKVYEILRWFLDDSHALDADGVYFTTDYISEAQKYTFMSLFDFYISPSRAEGQNLPLQEAMACGLVPVSTRNTAMLDYINESNAYIIPSSITEINHLNNPDESMWGFEWFDSSEMEIFKTILQALQAPEEELTIKRSAAQKTITEKYSFPAISESISLALSK
ncbi:glycosyltransferase [Azotobacter salinestris]|uniref:glycosyltransferase n=1 Tax=Azotobacter salinestris TaxID=69964 RepID=UPI0032DFA577